MAPSSSVVQSRPSLWRHRLKSIDIACIRRWLRCRRRRRRRDHRRYRLFTIFIDSFHTFRLFLFRFGLERVATAATTAAAGIFATIPTVIFLLFLWTFIDRCAIARMISARSLWFSFDEGCWRSGWHTFAMAVTAVRLVWLCGLLTGHCHLLIGLTFELVHWSCIQLHQLLAGIAQMLDAMFHMVRTE